MPAGSLRGQTVAKVSVSINGGANLAQCHNSRVIRRVLLQPHLFHREIILTALDLAFIKRGTDQVIAQPLTKGDLGEGVGVLQVPGIRFTHNLGACY